MRAVLGLPFATPLSGRLMLVFITGRRTGKSYRQPVSFVRDGTVLLTPGGGNWKLNLGDGRPERIRLRGRFVAIPKGPDGRLDRASLDAAVRHGFRIIRWHLDGTEAPSQTA